MIDLNNKKNSFGKSILIALKNRLNPGHILFIALIITANAFAWFTYMSKVTSSIDVKVKSWNVSFEFDNQEMSDYINFSVDQIYPGMTPYKESLSVKNDGDVPARLTYQIVSINVFDQYFTIEDGSLTEQQLVQIMKENYPFTITITTDKDIIDANGGTAVFYINVNWPFESVGTSGMSNDELDTYWGNKAYEFNKINPTKPCIKAKVKLSAVQIDN